MRDKESPQLLEELNKDIKLSEKTGNVPRLVHIDFNDISGGAYNWNEVKTKLENYGQFFKTNGVLANLWSTEFFLVFKVIVTSQATIQTNFHSSPI